MLNSQRGFVQVLYTVLVHRLHLGAVRGALRGAVHLHLHGGVHALDKQATSLVRTNPASCHLAWGLVNKVAAGGLPQGLL